MKQEYISKVEVKQVCQLLKIRDWTELLEPSITNEETEIILKKVNVKEMQIDVEDFRQGLEVELEHGIRFDDAKKMQEKYKKLITAEVILNQSILNQLS